MFLHIVVEDEDIFFLMRCLDSNGWINALTYGWQSLRFGPQAGFQFHFKVSDLDYFYIFLLCAYLQISEKMFSLNALEHSYLFKPWAT